MNISLTSVIKQQQVGESHAIKSDPRLKMI